jgi:hypothetical protein
MGSERVDTVSRSRKCATLQSNVVGLLDKRDWPGDTAVDTNGTYWRRTAWVPCNCKYITLFLWSRVLVVR